jgi:peroxiredoxin Q/BCP
MKRILAALMIAAATGALAVDVGEPAPAVGVPDSTGKNVSVADFKGKWVVLYFYPKSFTTGCTKEACNLRDQFAGLRDLDAVVLGASFDDVETQAKFREKYNLPFQLLSDDEKKLAKAYDAVGLGGLMAQRKTFIVDPSGKVAHVFKSVDVEKHAAQIQDVLKKLKSGSP